MVKKSKKKVEEYSRKKVGCFILALGKHYEPLGRCARDSFAKFHPDVPLFYCDNESIKTYSYLEKYLKGGKLHEGILKFQIAADLMREEGLDKLIVLGADTITCARLHEFLEVDICDILVTLDYPYPHMSERFHTQPYQEHLNADVVCFNNVHAIEKIIELCPKHETFSEQGALNEVAYSSEHGISCVLVERLVSRIQKMMDAEEGKTRQIYAPDPHQLLGMFDREGIPAKVCYNVRSKSTLYKDDRDQHGNRLTAAFSVICESEHKPWKPFVDLFFVKNGMLFTGDGRWIKVWHYCEGFGGTSEENMKRMVDTWVNDLFNEQTKKFFSEACDCGDFFTKKASTS